MRKLIQEMVRFALIFSALSGIGMFTTLMFWGTNLIEAAVCAAVYYIPSGLVAGLSVWVVYRLIRFAVKG